MVTCPGGTQLTLSEIIRSTTHKGKIIRVENVVQFRPTRWRVHQSEIFHHKQTSKETNRCIHPVGPHCRSELNHFIHPLKVLNEFPLKSIRHTLRK